MAGAQAFGSSAALAGSWVYLSKAGQLQLPTGIVMLEFSLFAFERASLVFWAVFSLFPSWTFTAPLPSLAVFQCSESHKILFIQDLGKRSRDSSGDLGRVLPAGRDPGEGAMWLPLGPNGASWERLSLIPGSKMRPRGIIGHIPGNN